jgi:Domain of unknown function (DUF4386)
LEAKDAHQFMSAMKRISPRAMARLAGLFALLEALTSGFGQVIVPGKLFVPGEAAATAAKVLTHASLLRLSIVAAVIGVVCHVVWTLLLYELFQIVSRRLSLLAAFLGLVAIAMQAVSSVFQLAPLSLLENGQSLNAFSIGQVQALAVMFFQLNARAFDIYLVLFGVWCVMIGYLVFESAFMPRILGVLEAIAGFCWITFLWLPLAHYLSPYNQAIAGFGEVSLMLWLLVIGVNSQRWNEKADAVAP